MLSINVLLQPHVFNSSFYFLSLVRAKKKGKKIIPIFIQKLRVRVICECVLYSNKYGTCITLVLVTQWLIAVHGQVLSVVRSGVQRC